jgi:hypothetical protein
LRTPPRGSGSCRSTIPSRPAAGRGRAASGARAATPTAARSASTPRTRNGLHDATTDPDRLARWWQRWPHANIGLVTGELVDVLDVDGPAGRTALRRWTTQHHLHLQGPLVRTGSGWHHYLAPPAPATAPGCWRVSTGAAAAATSSPHHPSTPTAPATGGCGRSPATSRTSRGRCATCLSRPGSSPARLPVPRFREEAAGHPYGRAALQRELAAVAQAPKGRRNHTLYQPASACTAWSPAACWTTPRSRPGCWPPQTSTGCSPRSPSRPAAPSPRPSAPASSTPAASPPATEHRATLRRVPCGRDRPEAVTTASAMPEPPPVARTTSRGRQHIGPCRSPASDAGHHRLAAAPLLRAIQQRARLRRQSLRELLGRSCSAPTATPTLPGPSAWSPGAVLRRGPRLAPPHALRRGLRPSHRPTAIEQPRRGIPSRCCDLILVSDSGLTAVRTCVPLLIGDR